MNNPDMDKHAIQSHPNSSPGAFMLSRAKAQVNYLKLNLNFNNKRQYFI